MEEWLYGRIRTSEPWLGRYFRPWEPVEELGDLDVRAGVGGGWLDGRIRLFPVHEDGIPVEPVRE